MDSNVLTSTFERMRSRLRNMARGITGSTYDADDALHDAFCRLWSRYSDIDSPDDAERIAYRAVHNASIDVVRASHRQSMTGLDTVCDEVADDYVTQDATEQAAVYQEVLLLAQRELTPRQYEIFRLHDLEQMDYAEVAAEMQTAEVNVRMALSRARKTIREIYRKRHNNE